jgi:hypothetical protein
MKLLDFEDCPNVEFWCARAGSVHEVVKAFVVLDIPAPCSSMHQVLSIKRPEQPLDTLPTYY